MTNASRLVAVVWLFGCACAAALADTASEIELIVRDRIAAAARGDAAAWRSHIADDCLWTGPGLANATTADAELAVTANASLPKPTIGISDFEVHEFGDTALATYVFTSGVDTSIKRFRKTDTYVRRAGDWRLIAAVEILVPTQDVAAIDPAEFDSYAGRYRLDASHIVRVWRDGDRLLSQADGERSATELLPSSRDSFFVDGDPGKYIFGRGHDGAVDRMIFRMEGGADIVLRRDPSP